MAKRYDNDKGFLIIQMELLEALVYCGIGNICDTCNNEIDVFEEDGFGDVYYFAAINMALCKHCCDDFIKGMNKSPEDEAFEKCHYNYYAKKLNLEEV